MDWLGLLSTEKFLVFTLVLTRVSGLLTTAGVFGIKEAPAKVRALLAMALAMLIMPSQWSVALPYPDSMLQYSFLLAGELLIGVALGLGVMVFMSGMVMAGELLSRIGGLTLSDIYDPTSGDTIPLFSKLLTLVSTAVFMILGGHRILMAGLLDTFRTIPPGDGVAKLFQSTSDGGSAGSGFLHSLMDMFTLLVTQSFQLGIRASIPVVTAILLATLVLGLISRTLPQLNILAIGFGLNAMITFAVLSLSIGAAVVAFQDQIEPTLQTVFQTLNASVHSLGPG